MTYRLPALIAAIVVTAVAIPASALAGGQRHHAHTRRVSGVVTAINPLSHTLTMRTRHARLHAASAGSGTLTISFGSAHVNGPDGAVVVGDTVTVTLASGTVASSIAVVGEPNGGNAGNGAAIPAVVGAVDPTNNTLTLTVSSNGGPNELTVSVTPTTVIADPGAGDAPSIASLKVGDHVIVFTDDMTAVPIVAIGILDDGQPSDPGTPPGTGSTGPSSPSGSTEPNLSVLSGTVETVGAYSFTVKSDNDGAFPQQTLTVEVTDSTSISGRNSSGGTVTGVANLQNGDQIELYYTTSSTQPLNAYKVADDGALVSTTPPSTTAPTRFGGTVTAIRGDGLTVTAVNGPLAGQSVIVSLSNTTSFSTSAGTGVGLSNLAHISVGDPVEIFTDADSSSPVVAVGVVDDSAATGSGD